MSARLLVVEDDDDLRALVAGRLADEGYTVDTAATGTAGLDAALAHAPDLVVLDVMLPEMDGLELARELRARLPRVYVLMLTARASEMDRVVGLEVGADDYLTKPFGLSELVARIRAGLRRLRLDQRADPEDVERPIVVGEIVVDPVRREVRRGAALVSLTAKEFDLLLFLARHPDRPFSRLALLEQVWQTRYEGYERTVDSHVQRLRAKVEPDPSAPTYIRTVWGIGYKLSTDAPPVAPSAGDASGSTA